MRDEFFYIRFTFTFIFFVTHHFQKMSESEMTGNLFLFTNAAATAPATERIKAEARLVERVCEGDAEAFNEIYKIFAPLVHGIVLARVPRDEAADIV